MKDFIANLLLIGAAVAGFHSIVNPVVNVRNSVPIAVAQSPDSMPPQVIVPTVTVTQPRLHKMNLEVSEPEDLKVKVGDAVSASQIIADQEGERARLSLQKEQLQLSLKRVESSTIIQPLAPKSVPELAPLPPYSTSEYEAAIDKGRIAAKTVAIIA